MASKMADSLDVNDSADNTSCRKLLETAKPRSSTAQRFHSKYRSAEAAAHSHSADAKLTDC